MPHTSSTVPRLSTNRRLWSAKSTIARIIGTRLLLIEGLHEFQGVAHHVLPRRQAGQDLLHAWLDLAARLHANPPESPGRGLHEHPIRVVHLHERGRRNGEMGS